MHLANHFADGNIFENATLFKSPFELVECGLIL